MQRACDFCGRPMPPSARRPVCSSLCRSRFHASGGTVRPAAQLQPSTAIYDACRGKAGCCWCSLRVWTGRHQRVGWWRCPASFVVSSPRSDKPGRRRVTRRRAAAPTPTARRCVVISIASRVEKTALVAASGRETTATASLAWFATRGSGRTGCGRLKVSGIGRHANRLLAACVGVGV
jgi:hypothetical protein